MKSTGKIFLIVLLLVAAVPGYSQLKGFSLGPYVEGAWLTGDAADRNKNGYGAGLSADIKLPGRLGITGSAGYMHFGSKGSGDGKTPAINAFPIRAGLKFRPIPVFYLKAEAGTAHFTKGDGTAFIFSPGIGVRILGVDLQGKYEVWFRDERVSFWGLRAGLNL